MKNITIQGRAIVSVDSNPVIDFRPFFGGREHGSGCTNCDWDIRGVASRGEDDYGHKLTVFTGGCCAGFLIEAIIRPDNTLEMGALLRLDPCPTIVIPVFFSGEKAKVKIATAMTYLVVQSSFDGTADEDDKFYDGLSLVSYHHNRGSAVELKRVKSGSLTSGGSKTWAGTRRPVSPKQVLDAHPTLLDTVEGLQTGKGEVAKKKTLDWASDTSNIVNAPWVS